MLTDDELDAIWLYAYEVWPGTFKVATQRDELEAKRQVWRDILGDLPPLDIRAALVTLADREFPPPPGLIRRTVVERSGSTLPPWDEFYGWVCGEAASSTLYLYDNAPQFKCPWPEMEGIVTLAHVMDWAREGLTQHDLETIIQAHVRHSYKARIETLQREAVSSAPAAQLGDAKHPRIDGEPKAIGELLDGYRKDDDDAADL